MQLIYVASIDQFGVNLSLSNFSRDKVQRIHDDDDDDEREKNEATNALKYQEMSLFIARFFGRCKCFNNLSNRKWHSL